MRLLLTLVLTLVMAGLAVGADRDAQPGSPDIYLQPENWSQGLAGDPMVIQDLRATTVYDTLADFLDLIADGYYYENFASIGYGDITDMSYAFGPVGGYSFTTSCDGGLYSVDGAMSTNSAGDPLVIAIDGVPATAVAGDFFCTDLSGAPITEPITVTLNDGTAVTMTYPTVFAGFISDEPITTITLTTDSTINAWVTVDNVYVGEAGTVDATASSFTQVKALFD